MMNSLSSTQLPKSWRRVAVKDMADSINTDTQLIRLRGRQGLGSFASQLFKMAAWIGMQFHLATFRPIEMIPKYRLSKGDLVFDRTGATTGKSFLIGDCPEAVFASYLIRVRVSSEVDSRYLSAFFQSPEYWQQIESGKRGIGQPNVNGKGTR